MLQPEDRRADIPARASVMMSLYHASYQLGGRGRLPTPNLGISPWWLAVIVTA
ncbi:MAG: hypothetical protein M3N29_01930 [Chloroflexota bacterium]|nr:hypothetical protein [Chloroflexota bacterium]